MDNGNKTETVKQRKPAMDYTLVGIQFLLFVIYLLEVKKLSFHGGMISEWAGAMLFLLGAIILLSALFKLGHSLSPYPSPLPEGQLVSSGMYKWMRHPIYSGILIAGFGFALYAGSGFKLLIILFLYILFYYKSNYEESLLMEKYPDYPAYRKRTGRFFPGL